MSDAPLRLIAFDEEDLAIVSAHAQDAVLRVQDMAFEPESRIFALLASRFGWSGDDTEQSQPCRCLSALEVRNVTKVRSRGVDMEKGDDVLNLLAVTFEADSPPSGDVVLHFSGGGAIRLTVECLETTLCDMGEAWQTSGCPHHDLPEEK